MELGVLADGFGYIESPRWHQNKLWFSDFDRREIVTITEKGDVESFAAVPGTPSGLAFHDSSVLVASMNTAEVLMFDAGGTPSRYADLSAYAVGALNDMVMGPDGTLYVGCFGYDLEAQERPRAGPLLAVYADGTVGVACADVTFANGMIVTPDGSTLLVAETPLRRITRFAITEGGRLEDRSVYAELGDTRQPDGLCLDAEGGLWVGSPFTEELIRIDGDGNVTHMVPTPGRWAIAAALGGHDGATLYVLTAETDLKQFAAGTSKGRVEVSPAPFPAMRS